MARKRSRGRPSFENSYKQRRKVYRRYVRQATNKKKRYGDNLDVMDYTDFVANYKEYRKRMKEIKSGVIEPSGKEAETATLSNFIEETVLVTKGQAASAADNFNSEIDNIIAKDNAGIQLSEYEMELYEFYLDNGYMTQNDIRGKSAKYQDAYNLAKGYGMGDEAFGS